MREKNIIEKYLTNYAEKEAAAIKSMTYRYQHVLIIPVFDELDTLFNTLNSVNEKSVLVVVVINSTNESSESAVKNNQILLRKIRRNYYEIWRAKNAQGISLHQTEKCGVLLVDRSSGQLKLPEKTGVGLARKIAADIALSLIHNNLISSSFIHSTDADVILPQDYFSRTKDLSKKVSAAIYPFEHITDQDCEKQKTAVFLYEISLRHYVINLKEAGSPYAFHTIGSTIAISANAYASVRGFPKKEAGEDFYMLNKLAKIGVIERLKGIPIKISGRISNRVPFGTGRAVGKITTMNNPLEEYEFYNPKIFTLLKFWLIELSQLTAISNVKKFEQRIRQYGKSPQLVCALEKIGAFRSIKNILANTGKNASPSQQINTWFDGFRTLKLIHHLRDNGFPSIQLSELINHPIYQQTKNICIEDIQSIKDHLTEIEVIYE